MIYKDKVYGNITIEEPVILELIKTKEIQRLKGIDQAGYPPLYYNPRSLPVSQITHNRFSHSLGVFYLLRRFGAGLEEQIAGLLHDVSHSAFSHCIDYVLDAGSEKEHSHQDNIFSSFIKKSRIPEILRKYGLSVDFIINDKNFPLKERSLPDICADRIDYSLRSALHLKVAAEKEIGYLLDHLEAKNNNWVFKDFKSAEKYSKLFFKLNKFYYSGIHSAVMFRAVGDALRHSLQKRYISDKDLYTTDKAVLLKIKRRLSKDKELELLFDRMNGKIKFTNNPRDFDVRVFCKSRIVNPYFLQGGKIERFSAANKKWTKIVEKEIKPKEYFIKFAR